MRVRRLRKTPAALEVTAFINLIVVLVPFLLSTAVFTRLAVLELSLPAKSAGVEQLKVDHLQLEVVIRPDALDVGDRVGGLIQHIPHTAQGPDLKALNALVMQVKAKYPEQKDATILAQPDTPYELLVKVMDATREGRTAREDGQVVKAELFPAISIGDAPRGTPAAAHGG
ncbi:MULTISPECIES: biopolymer transporter ExbD [Ideonella]|jgi:biopolymer transport protein ExbD|uniref:ExbD/TolR family protein n=1 Tax=Ideonella TaxID=36862 RepID=UPI0003B3D742|nr:biopolymer transporter ExbD [Ideonella sp. B508-1]